MSETKFTPGPWIQAGPSFGEPKMKFANSVIPDRDDDEYPDDICEMPFPYYDEEQEANAQLIAAAPELYDALNAMLTHMGMDEDEFTKVTFDQARAALAKARGEA